MDYQFLKLRIQAVESNKNISIRLQKGFIGLMKIEVGILVVPA